MKRKLKLLLKKKYKNDFQESKHFEQQKMLDFIIKYVKPESFILDVGCGYGRNIKLLMEKGFRVLGIEKNKQIVETNKEKGLACIHNDELEKTHLECDAIIMSHVIEHLSPDVLKNFIDFYLDYLKSDGYLIIATPLLSTSFYDDFDHIKPYQPKGIEMIFSDCRAQVQYYSRHKIRLIDIWFRRRYPRIRFAPGLYVKGYSKWPLFFNKIMAIIFYRSRGMFGKVDGWIGIYKKIGSS